MRIVVCSTDNNEQAKVSTKFARSKYFMIYDHNDLSISFIANPFLKEPSAGGKLPLYLKENNIDTVLVPQLGFNSFQGLKASKIKAYQYEKDMTVKDALYAFYENKLEEVLEHTDKK